MYIWQKGVINFDNLIKKYNNQQFIILFTFLFGSI